MHQEQYEELRERNAELRSLVDRQAQALSAVLEHQEKRARQLDQRMVQAESKIGLLSMLQQIVRTDILKLKSQPATELDEPEGAEDWVDPPHPPGSVLDRRFDSLLEEFKSVEGGAATP